MWPRKLLDIDWSDLAYGAYRCVRSGDISKQLRALERTCGGPDQAIVCLSVRTGFDLLLQSLSLPQGSEVIMTAITIPDMISIVRRHGLVPIPLDLEFETLSPSVETLIKACTDKTRLVVVAHLFGAWIPLGPLVEFAKRHQLVLIEDCAQSFCGWHCIQREGADVSLYSFGPIKTATSLGGALVRVRDTQVLRKMRQLHSRYTVQKRRSYAYRLVKYALLKLASHKFIYGWILRACSLCGRDPDLMVNSLAKNFGKGDLIQRIREQPCRAMISMLDRRRKTYLPTRIEDRTRLGNDLAYLLKDYVGMPGTRATHHSHWVFPIVHKAPKEMLASLRSQGFDATTRHNLCVLEIPLDEANRDAPVLTQLLRHVVFLPIYPELTHAAVESIVETIRRCSKNTLNHQPQDTVADPDATRCDKHTSV